MSWRRKADRPRRHGQQLQALETVVEVSLKAIDDSLRPSPSAPSRLIYEECRAADYRSCFIRRLWGFFRDRWDQRDDPKLTDLLAAADEVIWSCYQPPFRHLQRSSGPAPLAHLTADFSAHAISRRNPPPGLRESDRLLSRTVEELPVPLIGIPYACVNSPWWLVLIAHEVGHQVGYAIDELEDSPRIADLVAGAAREAGADSDLERDWRAWSHEVFADAYAAGTVGAAHLWALAELEQGSDETMVRELPSYPPPLVRYKLASSLVEQLGLASAGAVPPPPAPLELEDLAVSSEAKARIERVLEGVPKIASRLATAKVTGGATLPQLAGWDASLLSGGDDGAGWWRDQLRSGKATPEEGLEAPRLATVGALAAWAEIADEPELPARQKLAAALRQQMLAVLPASRETGYRSAGAGDKLDVSTLAKRVAAEVLRLPIDDGPASVAAAG